MVGLQDFDGTFRIFQSVTDGGKEIPKEIVYGSVKRSSTVINVDDSNDSSNYLPSLSADSGVPHLCLESLQGE